MPILRVRVDGVTQGFPFSPDQPVRDVLDTTDLRVRSACHGLGACGLCRIRVLEGEAGEPTPNERYHLRGTELREGVRLACQVRPRGDLTIELLNPAPESGWKSLPFPLFRDGQGRPGSAVGLRVPSLALQRPLGLAVDVGTTHLSLALLDLRDGRWLAQRWGLNPQAVLGADVVTRLVAASASLDAAGELNRRVVEAIRDGLWDILCREGFEPVHVVRVELVGNSAMLALLIGEGYERLLQPAQWSAPLDHFSPPDTAAWIRTWGVHPEAEVEMNAPLAGFVGTDLLAGLIATRLVEGGHPALFIDFGTNSEIALWDGSVLWVTAAAGGPAFESSGISHGVPAEPGAVFRVTYDPGTDRFSYGIIGEVTAKGICGSGLVDLLAALRRSGRLTATGHLREGGKSTARFEFTAAGRVLAVTDRDVDALQRAKAAIAAGIRTLCAKAGVDPHTLQRVCIAGAFGHYLDVSNAQAIGLLPPVAPERVQLVGNTALTGCADLLLYDAAATALESLRATARVINLALSPDFDDLFLAGLYLQPLLSDPDE